jgi:hypothetical protein
MAVEWQYMIDIRPTWVNARQSANWEASVRRHITWIGQTQSGRILLNSIKFHKKWVPISPYDGSEGACNAFVEAKVGKAKDGHDYAATVFYSPHLFQRGTACHPDSALENRGLLPDEILFHELVHAFRRVSGKRAWAETSGGLHRYDSNEEFIAILVTNIYVTDPTNRIKTGLRADHRDGAPLRAELAESFSFFESSMDTFRLVKQLVADHPGLTGALAKVPAAFNPIAAFVQDPAEAEKRSRSARAVIRDADGWATAVKGSLARWARVVGL